MYLSGSKWNMRKKRRHSNPWRVLLLILLIAAFVYLERFVVPTLPPPFIPTPTPTRSPATFILEAESLFEAGKLSQAEEAYQQAIEANPLEEQYFIDLARIQVFSGKYQAAEESASNAVLINPNSALANGILGWVLDFLAVDAEDAETRLGLLGEALIKVEAALVSDPGNALLQAFYAEVLIDNDIASYEQALAAAERAVQLDPNLMESHRALGYVWESTGNYAQAIDAYRAALRINSNIPVLHVAVGNMHQALNDIDSALESYLRAVALDPTNPDPLSLIAQAEARRGNYGKASQYAADALDKDLSNPRLHGNLGRMYYNNDEFDLAIQELRLAIQGGMTAEGDVVLGLPLDPGDERVTEFYYLFGLGLAKNNQCELAGQIFETLLRVVPENEVVVFNAQEGLAICGQFEATPTPEITETPTP